MESKSVSPMAELMESTMSAFVPALTVLLKEQRSAGSAGSLIIGFILGIAATVIGTLL